MKELSREEMKNVKGGYMPSGGTLCATEGMVCGSSEGGTGRCMAQQQGEEYCCCTVDNGNASCYAA